MAEPDTGIAAGCKELAAGNLAEHMPAVHMPVAGRMPAELVPDIRMAEAEPVLALPEKLLAEPEAEAPEGNHIAEYTGLAFPEGLVVAGLVVVPECAPLHFS